MEKQKKTTCLEDPGSGKDDLTDDQLTPREDESANSAKPSNDNSSTSTENENQEREKKPKRYFDVYQNSSRILKHEIYSLTFHYSKFISDKSNGNLI